MYPNKGSSSVKPITDNFDWKKVVLTGELNAEIFGNTAREVAQHIADGNNNEPTQLRKYYDELSMWYERVEVEPAKLREFLPFIRMLKAKVAYAEGRKKVDDRYVKLIECLVNQVDGENPETLKRAKLFLEAFTGYYKGFKA